MTKRPRILSVNMEVTTQCPLRCSFCYCRPSDFQHMPLDMALHWIEECEKNGVRTIGFSGGEVLCYPYLEDVIAAAHKAGCKTAVAISGYGLTRQKLLSLIRSGIGSIHVSLNGSTEVINQTTRNGYAFAIEALQLMQKEKFRHTVINFVLTRENADDFPEMLKLAENFQVRLLSVLSLKPDSHQNLSSRPTQQQMRTVAAFLDNYHGPAAVSVESCYSELICMLTSQSRLDREYAPPSSRRCRAGVHSLSIGVDGRPAPCRHLCLPENFTSIEEYLERSRIIPQLKALYDQPPKGCDGCDYRSLCRPCLGVRLDIQGTLDAPQPCQIL